MTDFVQAIVVALIASFVPTMMMLFALLMTVKIGRKVDEMYHATNSISERLIALTEKESLARGIKEGTATGVQQEKDRPKG